MLTAAPPNRDQQRPVVSIPAHAVLCGLGLAIAVGLWMLHTPADGPWGSRFIAGQAIAFAAYLGALALARSGRLRGVAALTLMLAFALGLRAVTWVRAPRLSTDFYRYIWDGRVANAGINPYRYAPADPKLSHLRDDLWRPINHKRVPTIYPPAAQILFAGLWRVPGGPERTFRCAFVLFDLAALGLVWMLLVRLRRPREWLVAYAWHPLVITEFVAGAHVDVVGVCFLLAALVLAPPANDRRVGWSAAALGLSIMTKGYALAALPFMFRRHGWRYPAWVAVTCAAVTAPFLGAGAALFGGLTQYVARWRSNASLLLWIERAVAPLTNDEAVAAKAIVLAALIVLAIWLMLRATRDDGDPVRNTFIILSAALLLGGPVLPWYVAWTVPFLCLWPVAGWVLFTGLASVAYYTHWSLPDAVSPAKQVEYGVVYAALAIEGAWRLSRLRRIGRVASTGSAEPSR